MDRSGLGWGFFPSPAAPLYVCPLASACAGRGKGFTHPAFARGLQKAAKMCQLGPGTLLGSGKFR